MLAAIEPLPQWVNFLAMFVAILLVALGSLIWFAMARKKRKRKRKHHNHEKRQLNPTLAECGGLPPKRDDLNSPAAGL
jgi:cytochrome c-type biogenesis protein CcmH/NrfF